MLYLKQNRLILAFPGMGKTPLSLRNPMFRDIDFGTFRKGLGYSKAEDLKLAPIFINYLRALDEDVNDVIFMSNEPKLMGLIDIYHVYVPRDPKFSARKMNVDEDTIKEWVQNWIDLAREFNVPVTQIDVGLDHYLGGTHAHRVHYLEK